MAYGFLLNVDPSIIKHAREMREGDSEKTCSKSIACLLRETKS